MLLRREVTANGTHKADQKEDRADENVKTMETRRHEEGRAVDRDLERKRSVNVLIGLHEGEQDTESNRDRQTGDHALAVIVQQSMVCPCQRRARQQQDNGVVKRQMQRIENLDALRRPDTAGEGSACYLMRFVRKQARIEERPKPGNEEHDFRSDEHDHAVAQMQRYDTGMVPLMSFLDRIRPPAV